MKRIFLFISACSLLGACVTTAPDKANLIPGSGNSAVVVMIKNGTHGVNDFYIFGYDEKAALDKPGSPPT